MSIVRGGDYSPHTTGMRLLFLANSLVGASVLSLVLSYLVQVYSALPQPGGFYGGWITADLVGPFKGVPGSMGW